MAIQSVRLSLGYSYADAVATGSLLWQLEIRSMERGICPIAVLYFAINVLSSTLKNKNRFAAAEVKERQREEAPLESVK